MNGKARHKSFWGVLFRGNQVIIQRLSAILHLDVQIDGDHYRIGWIEKSALPAGTKVERLKMSDFWENELYQQEIMEDCVMTDDPLGSGAAIAHLKTGQKVWSLAFLGAEWEMIVVEIDGQCYWGFVPTNCMSHG